MKIKTFLPVFTGFYGTIFEPDVSFEIENQIEATGDDSLTFDDLEFDYEGYYNRVAKGCCDWVERELGMFKGLVDVCFEEVVSPREYNFTNDSINCTIECNKVFRDEVYQYLVDNRDYFAIYLTEKYLSRAGFVSSYSSEVTTWMGQYWSEIETNEHIFGAILEFIFENEELTQQDMYDSCETYLESELKTKTV